MTNTLEAAIASLANAAAAMNAAVAELGRTPVVTAPPTIGYGVQTAAAATTAPPPATPAPQLNNSNSVSSPYMFMKAMQNSVTPSRNPYEQYVSDFLRTKNANYLSPDPRTVVFPVVMDAIYHETSEEERFVTELRQRIFAKSRLDGFNVQDVIDRLGGPAIYSKALNTTTAADGGNMIQPSQIAEVYDIFRVTLALKQAGCTMVTFDQAGNYLMSRLKETATAGWGAEGATITELTTTKFGSSQLSRKKLTALFRMTNEFLRNSMGGTEQLVMADLAWVMARNVDTAFYSGGGADEPRGYLNYATASAWSQGNDHLVTKLTPAVTGTNGDTLGPQDILNLIFSMPDGVDMKNILMRKQMFRAIAGRRWDSGETADDGKGGFLFWNPIGSNSVMNWNFFNVPVIPSANVPKNITKGSTTDCTTVVGGDFSEVYVASGGVAEILVNPYGTGFSTDSVETRAISFHDIGIKRPAALSYFTQILEA